MSRTTVKQQAILLREARQALGIRYNKDVWQHINPLQKAVEEFLGRRTIIISHYRGGSWGVTWLGKDCRDCFVPFAADKLALPPQKFVDAVVRPEVEWLERLG